MTSCDQTLRFCCSCGAPHRLRCERANFWWAKWPTLWETAFGWTLAWWRMVAAGLSTMNRPTGSARVGELTPHPLPLQSSWPHQRWHITATWNTMEDQISWVLDLDWISVETMTLVNIQELFSGQPWHSHPRFHLQGWREVVEARQNLSQPQGVTCDLGDVGWDLDVFFEDEKTRI